MQAELRITGLPADAIGAARSFYDNWLGRAEEALAAADALAIILPPAPCDHDDWRRAVARDLARAHAPTRVNVVAGMDDAVMATTLAYLGQADGVTGQFLQVDGNRPAKGAG